MGNEDGGGGQRVFTDEHVGSGRWWDVELKFYTFRIS